MAKGTSYCIAYSSEREQAETRHWLATAKACGYLEISKHAEYLKMCVEAGRMLGNMMNNADSWCAGND